VGSRPKPNISGRYVSRIATTRHGQVVNNAPYNALSNALYSCKRTIFCCKSMAQPIPQALSHLVALNVEYGVLICIGNGCKCALKPSAIPRHLAIKHKTAVELRKQVDQYVAAFPFEYDYKTVRLPQDGSAPQPVIPVVGGFACKDCPFKTRDRSTIRKHANKVHNRKRVADEDIFQAAQLQSWFGEKRERYWAVDESQQIAQER
jgi:hypothetical protein